MMLGRLWLWTQMIVIAESLSDAYQESILHSYHSYSDVAIFHYYVPTQVTRASWEFAAFMDNPSCIERVVYIYLQPGSYPVVNPHNSSFAPGTYIERKQQYSLVTTTKHQPHDAVVFHAFNPLPGNWFAVAYILDWNHKVRQQGLSHGCKYSLGSIASWQQASSVTLLIPGMPSLFTSQSQYAYFKFYIPENIWSFELGVSNCTTESTSSLSVPCVQGVGLQANALPFVSELNATDGNGNLVIRQPQPMQKVDYFVLISALSPARYELIVRMEECAGFTSSDADADLEGLSVTTHFTRRHSNQSVSADWEATLLGAPPSPLSHEDFRTANTGCLPVIPLARIKHAQDFMDNFVVQGRDWYTSWLVVNHFGILVIKWELLPFIDIGGTLKFGVRRFEAAATNVSHQVVVLLVCISHGSPPTVNHQGRLVCQTSLAMNVSSLVSDEPESTMYFPFPQPGLWFAAFEATCYEDTPSGLVLEPCQTRQSTLYLDVRLQPCIVDGGHCGTHGLCQENHRGQFFFSACHCTEGWRGWGCSDDSEAHSPDSLILKTLLLTSSNLFFVPAILLAVKRKFFTEAVVYAFTMIFSCLYHACDEETFSFCLLKYDVLQFCDFYAAVMAFWVTLLALASLSWQLTSALHMAGALIIALGVECQRTSLWTFVVPVSTGILVISVAWINQCRQQKSCFPVRRWWIMNLVPGMGLVISGLFLFAFVETEQNYHYTHSLWHVIVALAIVFLLPQQRSEMQQTLLCVEDSELIDVNDYSLSTDFEHLISSNP